MRLLISLVALLALGCCDVQGTRSDNTESTRQRVSELTERELYYGQVVYVGSGFYRGHVCVVNKDKSPLSGRYSCTLYCKFTVDYQGSKRIVRYGYPPSGPALIYANDCEPDDFADSLTLSDDPMTLNIAKRVIR